MIIYFRSDIRRLASAWLRGLVNGKTREAPDYRFAWYVILGSIPIGIVRFLAQGPISGPLRNLWVVVVVALVGWSAVMWHHGVHLVSRGTGGAHRRARRRGGSGRRLVG